MNFNENNFEQYKPEDEKRFFDSSEELRQETERLRKQNQEKIDKINEENDEYVKNLGKERGPTGQEKGAQTEGNAQKQEKQNWEKEDEKRTDGKKGKHRNSRDDYKKEQAEKKEDELKQKREKYSKEFQKRPLNADRIDPKEYSQQMRDGDLRYLSEWMDYEKGRTDWLKDELTIEKERRYEVAFSKEQREELKKRYYDNIKFLNEDLQKKWSEYHIERERVVEMYLRKKDTRREEEEWKKRREEEKKREEEEKNKKDGKKPGEERDKEKEKQLKAERIALEELRISGQEYTAITRGNLGNNELLGLIKRVFGILNIDKISVKKGFQECALNWHPDTKKTRYGIGVNEIKFKIANNLYQEYIKRFGK